MNSKVYLFLMNILEDLMESDTKLLPSELEIFLAPLEDKEFMNILVMFYSAGSLQRNWVRPASP